MYQLMQRCIHGYSVEVDLVQVGSFWLFQTRLTLPGLRCHQLDSQHTTIRAKLRFAYYGSVDQLMQVRTQKS